MAPDRGGEVAGLDRVALAAAVGVVDDAGEFPEVARPVVTEERLDRLVTETAALAAAAEVGAFEEVLREDRQLFQTLAERPQADDQGRQRVVQVVADALVAEREFRVARGRGDQPDPRVDRGGEPALEVARQVEEVADLERRALGQGEPGRGGGVPVLVARPEQLPLQDFGGERRAVERDERGLRRLAELVDRAGDEPLTRPRRADDQDRDGRRRGRGDLVEESPVRRPAADQVVEPVAAEEPVPHLQEFGPEPLRLRVGG